MSICVGSWIKTHRAGKFVTRTRYIVPLRLDCVGSLRDWAAIRCVLLRGIVQAVALPRISSTNYDAFSVGQRMSHLTGLLVVLKVSLLLSRRRCPVRLLGQLFICDLAEDLYTLRN